VCRMATREVTDSPQSPALVRRWAVEVLQHWDLTTETDRVLLVLNELVTNAVVHSPGDARCRMTVDCGFLEVLVTDAGNGPPRRALRAAHHPDPDEWERSGGRGLQIVAAVADAWGAALHDGRSGMWARWPVAAGWGYEHACTCTDEHAAEHGVRLGSGSVAVAIPGPWDEPAAHLR
jgi:anti-sigma regulatory factor (Ser/Thr protein kinase)